MCWTGRNSALGEENVSDENTHDLRTSIRRPTFAIPWKVFMVFLFERQCAFLKLAARARHYPDGAIAKRTSTMIS